MQINEKNYKKRVDIRVKLCNNHFKKQRYMILKNSVLLGMYFMLSFITVWVGGLERLCLSRRSDIVNGETDKQRGKLVSIASNECVKGNQKCKREF